MNLRTPLGRVRGLGSAKEGTDHWWALRVTSIALVPLSLWFVIALMSVAHADYATAIEWIGQPWNSALLVVFLIAMFYHAILGMEEVMQDYFHHEGVKVAAILVMKFILVVLGAAAVIAVLRIAFLSVLRIAFGS